jgi:hypothetical protein
MAATKSGNATHDANCLQAEGVRQAAIAVATTQSAAKAADIAAFRTMLASAIANTCGPTQFINALRELGTGGT